MNEKQQLRQHEIGCAALKFALTAIIRSNALTTFNKLYPSIFL